MCNAIVKSDTLLPATIDVAHHSVTHICWDNFYLNEETPYGAGTTHSTHCIVVQGTHEERSSVPTESTVPRQRNELSKPQELKL